jgi:hypothetical protein
VGLYSDCKKHLKEVPGLAQNSSCPYGYLRQGDIEHSGNIQGAFREHSGNTREHIGGTAWLSPMLIDDCIVCFQYALVRQHMSKLSTYVGIIEVSTY